MDRRTRGHGPLSWSATFPILISLRYTSHRIRWRHCNDLMRAFMFGTAETLPKPTRFPSNKFGQTLQSIIKRPWPEHHTPTNGLWRWPPRPLIKQAGRAPPPLPPPPSPYRRSDGKIGEAKDEQRAETLPMIDVERAACTPASHPRPLKMYLTKASPVTPPRSCPSHHREDAFGTIRQAHQVHPSPLATHHHIYETSPPPPPHRRPSDRSSSGRRGARPMQNWDAQSPRARSRQGKSSLAGTLAQSISGTAGSSNYDSLAPQQTPQVGRYCSPRPPPRPPPPPSPPPPPPPPNPLHRLADGPQPGDELLSATTDR